MTRTWHSWHSRPLVGFDLETTGTDPESDRIVSAAVVRWGGGKPTESLTWLADPGVEIPAQATAIHKITTEAARSAGRPAPDVIEEITEVLADAVAEGLPIVVMNASYDLTLLDREARRHGTAPLSIRSAPRVLDPKVLDKEVDRYRRGKRTLSALCEHYVVPLEGAHNSEADAKAACAVTWKIAKRYWWLTTKYSLGELHDAQVRWARRHAEGLRDHYASSGQHERAADVRLDWPLSPAGGGPR
ncbi:exonuclease domain-containing protein [Streptomyces sp. NRRL B-1347]|uniref:exonuclease domain-containing protein n=1 Tax=Streptomyces sp. NRRL B-1347 TaxID=1476877 RepID=UPI0004C50605|nr:exonuclease domain-containing protein [Streptomyces sp. NRRL B-1347]